MVPITKFPRWLEYEHRTWFPKLDETIRAIEKEAQYLWLPQEAARNFVERMIPIADGKKLISRRKRKEPGIIEVFRVAYDTPAITKLREAYGSIELAARDFDYSIFQLPPMHVRIGDDVF